MNPTQIVIDVWLFLTVLANLTIVKKKIISDTAFFLLSIILHTLYTVDKSQLAKLLFNPTNKQSHHHILLISGNAQLQKISFQYQCVLQKIELTLAYDTRNYGLHASQQRNTQINSSKLKANLII